MSTLKKISTEEEQPILPKAIIRQLDSCLHVLEVIREDQYQNKISFHTDSQRIKGSVGEHIRHLIEFIQSVVLFDEKNSIIDYDDRKRNLKIQSNVSYACDVIQDLRARLKCLNQKDLTREVKVLEAVDINYDDQPQISTFGRELLFVVSHTEHHFNTILERCDQMDVVLPDDFGMATSTLRHLKKA